MELRDLLVKIENDCYSDRYREAVEEVNVFIEEINRSNENIKYLPVLKVLLSAMEKGDNVLIGDCLKYGFESILKGYSVSDEVFNENLGVVPDIGEDIYYYASYSEEPVLCKRNPDGNMVRLNSIFSPYNEVDVWVSNLNLKAKTPVVCLFGLGTGLFAEALLKKMPEDSKLIICEPNREILDFCLESGQNDNSEDSEKKVAKRLESIIRDKRTSLLIETEDKLEFRYTLEKKVNYMELSCLTVAKHNNYDQIYPKSCLNYLREINNHRLKIITNKNTVAFFKEYLINNLFENMQYYKHINFCDEIDKILPDDIPAIVVSAGPSLDKNIDLLSQVKGHFLIFAVDTAVRYLLKKNIIPDLTITIDSKKPANYFCDEMSHQIPCIFDVTANPAIVSKHKGRMFLFNNSNFYMCALFEAIGKEFKMIPNGGSVATAAFALLYVLKQKKIILIGQDLASSNGATHAGGVDDKSGYTESLVEGYYGGQVTTRSDWLGYLKWFENAIEAIKGDDESIRIIDATEGGAKIHGAEIMSLQETIDECRDSEGNLPIYDFDQELKKLDYCLSENEYKELLRAHNDSLDKLKEIEIKAEEAIRICDKLILGIEKGTVSASYVDKEKKKISRINDWCSKTKIFSLVNDYLITDVIDEVSRLRFADGNIKETELNGINLLKISFEAIDKAAKTIYTKAKEISDNR